MPHLALDTTYEPTATERHACTDAITERYVDLMATTDGHVAVTIREHEPGAMSLGRAVEGPIAVLDADIRRGRSAARRRSFALAVVDWLEANWDLPRPNVKVVFTEHDGAEMMGADRVGGEWTPGDEG